MHALRKSQNEKMISIMTGPRRLPTYFFRGLLQCLLQVMDPNLLLFNSRSQLHLLPSQHACQQHSNLQNVIPEHTDLMSLAAQVEVLWFKRSNLQNVIPEHIDLMSLAAQVEVLWFKPSGLT